MAAKVKVTLVRSLIGRLPSHRACARGLGLRRLQQTVEVEATPQNLGMMRRIKYMLRVEEV